MRTLNGGASAVRASSGVLLAALVGGAAVAAVLLRYAPAAAPVLQLAALAIVLGLATVVHREQRLQP